MRLLHDQAREDVPHELSDDTLRETLAAIAKRDWYRFYELILTTQQRDRWHLAGAYMDGASQRAVPASEDRR